MATSNCPTAPVTGTATKLASFREKPDLATRRRRCSTPAGSCGTPASSCSVRPTSSPTFEANAPDLVGPCRAAIETGADDLTFFRLNAEAYGRARSISFDYAVMEKAKDVVAVPLRSGWSDLGSWDALWQIANPDGNGVATVRHGDGDRLPGQLPAVRGSGDACSSASGLDGIVAVAMHDAVLVAAKDRAQDVKNVVGVLRAAGAPQADDYPRFHRPWGWYETLCLGGRFQVKRIMVKPGGVLSLQSHMHRSEHWVVVEGHRRGDDRRRRPPRDRERRRLHPPWARSTGWRTAGKLPMYLIEVQTGAYLGEDDIIRYEDMYNRG